LLRREEKNLVMSLFNEQGDEGSSEVVLNSSEDQGDESGSEQSETSVDTGELKMVLETNREILKVLKDIRDSMDQDSSGENLESSDGRDADLGVGL
jgi:hypothetical protein